MIMEKTVIACLLIGMIAVSTVSGGYTPPPNCSVGVWNNFDFHRPAEDWSYAAQKFGGEKGVIDLVVAQANINGHTYLPFPFESRGYLCSFSQIDKLEPYLEKFDAEGLKVILSIQPLKVDVTQIIEILLTLYGHHKCIIGVNVDLEWKETGIPMHVSNEERDIWLNEIRRHNSKLKLFLTYFVDHTHFPEDMDNLVILFDGENATQFSLLRQYKELADHYTSVGIYTGYSSSVPPTASYERIMAAVPNTEYIIHTDDVFSNKTVLIFLMSDVQVDWLESTSIDLINLHMQKSVPVVCGVIPNNLDNPSVGGGFLPSHLKYLNENFLDLFEIAEHGYTPNAPEELKGKSYKEQKKIIKSGLKNLTSIGIKPTTFLPPFGSADGTTVKVAEDLGFKTLVSLSGNLNSDKLLIIDSWISLTEAVESETVLKSPERLMAEIDQIDKKVVIVSYHIHDFRLGSGNKVEELGKIIDILKYSEKYQFMTSREYQETLRDGTLPPSGQTPLQWPILPDWSLYVIIGALVIATLVLLEARRVRLK